MSKRTIPCLVILAVSLAGQAAADGLAIPARELSDRSENVAVEYPQFGNLTLLVGQGGYMQWTAAVPAGRYFVHFLYASGEKRPCRMTAGGTSCAEPVLGETTGGFMPEHLAWKTYGPFALAPDNSRIRIASDGYMPHLKGLYISAENNPPSGDVLLTTKEKCSKVKATLGFDALRKAIVHLADKYGDVYSQSGQYLDQVQAMEAELAGGLEDLPSLEALAAKAERLRYEALVRDNPLFACGKLLFVKRFTYQSSHYYTEFIDGCRHFGGNLCLLSLADGSVVELVPELGEGIFGRCDLDFDARRVVFDYKARPGEGFRIWEVGVDGSGLRRITGPPSDEQARIEKYWQRDSQFLADRQADYRHHTDDMHPCYLPDGGFCFISTRCERGILCDGADVLTTTTLYRMEADGTKMEVLSDSPVSEASPSVTNDGRILYTRWEYVDKADVVIKCLWAMRPDGTGSVEVFGNDITFPDTLIHGRAVPGSNHLFAVIGAPHMPASSGTVIRLDVNYPIRTREPMKYLTPEVDVQSEFGWVHKQGQAWTSDTAGPLYADVRPLDDTFFLVSCNPDRPWNDVSAYGLYLIDAFGNRVLIHRDQTTSCWQPIPLQPRPRPPVFPSMKPKEAKSPEWATVVVSDVYAGVGSVPRGTVKYLRVMETVPRPWAARHFWDGDTRYQQHAVVSMNTHLHVKQLHGVVPVEPDGSAHFRVPADRNLFFQALDEDFMEVQRMRTFVDFRPGETRSCTGCHDRRASAPASKTLLALRRPPSDPAPQPGETAPRPLYYPADVQPILDRHCLRCHNAQRSDGGLDLSGELTELFSRSYENLLNRDLVNVVRENQPKTGEAAPIPPYTLGSHASRLIQLIRQGHEDVTLAREEFIRLVTWVDANAPYYGSYYGRRNLKYRDHPDFRPAPQLP